MSNNPKVIGVDIVEELWTMNGNAQEIQKWEGRIYTQQASELC